MDEQLRIYSLEKFYKREIVNFKTIEKSHMYSEKSTNSFRMERKKDSLIILRTDFSFYNCLIIFWHFCFSLAKSMFSGSSI